MGMDWEGAGTPLPFPQRSPSLRSATVNHRTLVATPLQGKGPGSIWAFNQSRWECSVNNR